MGFITQCLIRSTFGEDSLSFFQPVRIYKGHLEEVYFLHFFFFINFSLIRIITCKEGTVELLYHTIFGVESPRSQICKFYLEASLEFEKMSNFYFNCLQH